MLLTNLIDGSLLVTVAFNHHSQTLLKCLRYLHIKQPQSNHVTLLHIACLHHLTRLHAVTGRLYHRFAHHITHTALWVFIFVTLLSLFTHHFFFTHWNDHHCWSTTRSLNLEERVVVTTAFLALLAVINIFANNALKADTWNWAHVTATTLYTLVLNEWLSWGTVRHWQNASLICFLTRSITFFLANELVENSRRTFLELLLTQRGTLVFLLGFSQNSTEVVQASLVSIQAVWVIDSTFVASLTGEFMTHELEIVVQTVGGQIRNLTFLSVLSAME